MAISGSDLYNEVKPILDEGSTNLLQFREDVGTAISNYVAANFELIGGYIGQTSGGSPVVADAVGKLVPAPPLPAMLADPMPFSDYITWFKNTLDTTVLWNVIALPPFTNTPVIFTPTTIMLDVLGDFSDLRTSYGFWAMVCDAIVCCIQGFTPVVTPASTTGSSGNIVWSPTDIPEVQHNFIFRITYDPNNLALMQWIREYITEVEIPNPVDIPFNNYTYQSVLLLWKALVALTTDCEFYKKQDSGELILLRTGSQV